MSFSYFGTAVQPIDNATLFDAGPANVSVTPPASMQAGDFVCLWCDRRSTADIVMGDDGGQSWTAGTVRQTGSSSTKLFWCTFNGTWSANPSIVTIANPSILISLEMEVWRPSGVVSVDVAESFHTYNAPVTPFDVTAPSVTPVASDTLQIFRWFSLDKNTWGLQSPPAGVVNAGSAYYRNVDNSGASKNMSHSTAYLVQAAANPTGTVTNRQLTLGGDPGLYLTYSFKEIGAGVTVTGAGDALFHNGDTGIVITGTSFGASQGTGSVVISPTNSITDPGAVTQTISSWGDTSITLGAVSMGTFGYFSNLYLFVKNNSGSSNATGFIVQREPWAVVSYIVKNKTGTVQASLTNVNFRLTATTLNGTVVDSGTNGTTDGSGIFTRTVVLTSGGALAPGGDVWLSIATQGASQALSPASLVRVTPTNT